ncbi:MAG: hypothetical protein V1936_04530 [Patescibacteria group bacterium]
MSPQAEVASSSGVESVSDLAGTVRKFCEEALAALPFSAAEQVILNARVICRSTCPGSELNQARIDKLLLNVNTTEADPRTRDLILRCFAGFDSTYYRRQLEKAE